MSPSGERGTSAIRRFAQQSHGQELIPYDDPNIKFGYTVLWAADHPRRKA